MKITIDTKEDSHEEIKKIISMLSSLVESEEVMANQNIFEGSSDNKKTENTSTAGIFNMFGSAESPASNSSEGPKVKSVETTTDVDSEIKIEPKEDTESTEKRIDLGIPQLEEYDD